MPNVTVKLSNLKKGSKVTIPGLGVFENGSTTEIDKKVLNRFVGSNPIASSVVNGDNVLITNEKVESKKPAEKASTKKKQDSTEDKLTKEDQGD